MPVVAYNEKGKKQIFSDLAWKALGKNKGGWTEKIPQKVSNTIEFKGKKPDMGPTKTKQVISNTIEKEPESTIEAEKEVSKGHTEEDIVDNQISDLEAKKSEFLKASDGISKSQIKDFFDQQNPPVKYKNRGNDKDFQSQLAEYLNYDIAALQKSFK